MPVLLSRVEGAPPKEPCRGIVVDVVVVVLDDRQAALQESQGHDVAESLVLVDEGTEAIAFLLEFFFLRHRVDVRQAVAG